MLSILRVDAGHRSEKLSTHLNMTPGAVYYAVILALIANGWVTCKEGTHSDATRYIPTSQEWRSCLQIRAASGYPPFLPPCCNVQRRLPVAVGLVDPGR